MATKRHKKTRKGAEGGRSLRDRGKWTVAGWECPKVEGLKGGRAKGGEGGASVARGGLCRYATGGLWTVDGGLAFQSRDPSGPVWRQCSLRFLSFCQGSGET